MKPQTVTRVAIAGVTIPALIIALVILIHDLHPHLPAIRDFIHWALDPRLAMGMGFGMLLGAGIVYCVLRDDQRPVEDLL